MKFFKKKTEVKRTKSKKLQKQLTTKRRRPGDLLSDLTAWACDEVAMLNWVTAEKDEEEGFSLVELLENERLGLNPKPQQQSLNQPHKQI